MSVAGVSLASPASGRKRRKSDNMGDILVRNARERIDALLDEAVEKDAAQIFAFLAFLEGGGANVAKAAEPDAGARKPFPYTYVQLRQLPKEHLYETLVRWEPNVCMSVERMRAVERMKKGTIHELFYMGTVTSQGARWPKFTHDKDIFDAVFDEAYEESGWLM